jgi:hypothetical protein
MTETPVAHVGPSYHPRRKPEEVFEVRAGVVVVEIGPLGLVEWETTGRGYADDTGSWIELRSGDDRRFASEAGLRQRGIVL